LREKPERAGDLIGAEIQKLFPGHGTFSGRVVDIHTDASVPGEVLFEIVYSDGDGEILSYDDLKPLLVGPVVAAAAYASTDYSSLEGTRVPGFDFAEVMPASAGGAISAETLIKAELVVKFLTCASTQVWEASQVPPGEQYSWHEIWRMRPADRQKHVEAMQAEIDKLITAGHMEWADLPAGEIAIPAFGVFRLK
jgi:hypothetical protein